MRRGSKQHEQELQKTIADMRNEGYRILDLHGNSPDAIAVKEDVIVAVEVLGKDWRIRPNGKTKELHGSWTYAGKERQYSMFDEVKIVTFIRNKEGFNDEELTEAILRYLKASHQREVRTNEIWENMPWQVSQRRIRQILAFLETKKLVCSEIREDGRHGRYRIYKLW